MRSYFWPAIASLALISASGASAQQVANVQAAPAAGAKADVLRPGSGSFASYLSQTTAPVAPVFVLRKGELLHTQLQAWAVASGWELLWLPDVSWKVLGDTTFAGAADVTAAVTEVINVLREEGRPVRLSIADGNKIMEVLSTDVVSNRETNGD